jgi:hypothetical protein
MSIIRRWGAAHSISLIVRSAIIRIVARTRLLGAAVVSRVLECAGRGSLIVASWARRRCAIVLTVVWALLAGEVGASLGRRLVVIRARGGCAWWALSGGGVALGHHLRSLITVNIRI